MKKMFAFMLLLVLVSYSYAGNVYRYAGGTDPGGVEVAAVNATCTINWYCSFYSTNSGGYGDAFIAPVYGGSFLDYYQFYGPGSIHYNNNFYGTWSNVYIGIYANANASGLVGVSWD